MTISLEEFESNAYRNGYKSGYSAGVDATFNPKLRWKNAAKEVPELNTQVLCFNGSKRFGAYTIAEIITDSLGQMAWHVYGVHEYDAGFGTVTHWMPLPEAPE